MTDRTRKISVLLDESDFQQLDKLCYLKGYKKSTLIARLVRDFLNEADSQIKNDTQQCEDQPKDSH